MAITQPQSQSKLICIVDDDAQIRETLEELLAKNGFARKTFANPIEFLSWWNQNRDQCGLIITDVNMPELFGFDLVKEVRKWCSPQILPIIMITANEAEDKVEGIEAGADDFIRKPFRSMELMSKVRSLLKIQSESFKIQLQLKSIEEKNDSLKKFLSPNVADLLGDDTGRSLLKPHPAEISVMFIDLRGFTSFAAHMHEEETLELLQQYYSVVGHLTLRNEGTIGSFAGDGIMVFFNDPVHLHNHVEICIQTAMQIRTALCELKHVWDQRNHTVHFGMGIAKGNATIGGIGFEKFWQYTVIGTVANLASRLCHEAQGGEILTPEDLLSDPRIKNLNLQMNEKGKKSLKGIDRPVSLYNIL